MPEGIIHAVLHCALNTRDRHTASALYTGGLGMRIVMRVDGTGLEGGPLGIPGSTDTQVEFLYDRRGPRVGTAIEVQEWLSPPTEGEAYEPFDVGMQSLGFHVPSASSAREQLVGCGARSVDRSAAGVVDAVLLDADGVTIELVEDASLAGAEMRYFRLLCGDLERAAAWYASIGFTPVGGPTPLTWKEADGTVAEATQQVMRVQGPPAVDLLLTADPRTPAGQRAHVRANHRGIFRMALAVRDVAVAVVEVRELGIECLDPTVMALPGSPLGGVTVSIARDPDGVMVEFVERDI